MFARLYEKTLTYARHRYAVWYLSALSFAESSFFPIPPDVILAPMALANPRRALHFALVTTLTSVLGGLFGYAIGFFAFEAITPALYKLNYWQHYLTAKAWFDEWGFWAVFVAGFSPIPYKAFTVTAGALSMAIPPFLLASLIGRGARFFLVAGLLRWGGERLERHLRTYIDRIGWATVGLVVLVLIVYRYGRP